MLRKRVAAHTIKPTKKKFGDPEDPQEAQRMRPGDMIKFLEQLTAIYRESGRKSPS